MKKRDNPKKIVNIFLRNFSSKTSKNLVGKGFFTGTMMDDCCLKSCFNSEALAHIKNTHIPQLNIEVKK